MPNVLQAIPPVMCETEKKTTAIFICQTCSRSLLKAPDEIKHLRQTLIKQLSESQMELSTKSKECEKLSDENKDLWENVFSLTAELNKAKWQGFKTNGSQETVFFSDSMMRYIDSQKLVSTKIVSLSGAKIKHIHEEICKPEYHGSKLGRAVIVEATNNVSDAKGNLDTVPDMISKCKSLITDVKAIAVEVLVSSICPHQDNTNNLVDTFNTGLQVLGQDEGVSFIDNTPAFTCGDGTTNDSYLINSNSPHLNKAGLNKLAKNLKLWAKEGITDVVKSSKPKHQHDGNGSSNAACPRRNTLHGSSKGAVNGPAQYNQRRSSQMSHREYSSRDHHQWDGPSPIQYNRDACVLCNEGGHHSTDCRHRHLGPLKCRACGDYGHKANITILHMKTTRRQAMCFHGLHLGKCVKILHVIP